MKLRVLLTHDDLDDGWIAECLDLPGCMSQGGTYTEVISNIRNAIAEVIAVRKGTIDIMILELGVHKALEVRVNDLGSPYDIFCHDCGSSFWLSQVANLPGVGLTEYLLHLDDVSFFEDRLGIPKDSPYR